MKVPLGDELPQRGNDRRRPIVDAVGADVKAEIGQGGSEALCRRGA
jgi:hypothetical protein